MRQRVSCEKETIMSGMVRTKYRESTATPVFVARKPVHSCGNDGMKCHASSSDSGIGQP